MSPPYPSICFRIQVIFFSYARCFFYFKKIERCNKLYEYVEQLNSTKNKSQIKEGVVVAASHPVITCGATASLGLLVLKRSRRIMYYNAKQLFVSEESLISKASAEVIELRKSIDLLKSEVEKMEKNALHAEEQFLHGRTKLRDAGKQIRNVIRSAYKIERRAGGLKDILGELPKREASHFRSQVSKLASEAKREKNSLAKEVSKISNYGISV